MNTETVVESGKMASILCHIKNNRIEYIGLAIICHLMGLTDKILSQTSGVCL